MIQAFRRLCVGILFLCLMTPLVYASAPKQASQKEEGGVSNSIDVLGTVSNHYDFEYPGGALPLPRILLVKGKWYFFANTDAAVESGHFVEKDDDLVPADGSKITLDLSISSHLIYLWLSLILTLVLTFMMVKWYKEGRGRKTEPQGVIQNSFEAIFIFIRDNVAKHSIPEDQWKRFLPYLFSVFVAITFMNLCSLLPWGATPTADITVTAVLAGFTFVLTQWNGSKSHWEHVFWYPGVPTWVRIILMPIEIFGLFTKPFALCVRLFANMLSGKMLIICIIGLIFLFTELFGTIAGSLTPLLAIPLTVSIFALKFLISLIQAYVFTLLSGVFIGLAIEEDESHQNEAVEAYA